MNWKKRLLSGFRLYVVIDTKILGARNLSLVARSLALNGAGIIQLRDKDCSRYQLLEYARDLRKAVDGLPVISIINDYTDIASIAECDGIHLGQEDTSIESARDILGKDKIIGISCHNLKEAEEAQDKGADYIGLGPVFNTTTKPGCPPINQEIIAKVIRKIKVPVFVIGGINRCNIGRLIQMGAQRLALCQAILGGGNIVENTRYFRGLTKGPVSCSLNLN
ncbi:MAG: thiamine phosphate synthase [Candidatus Omnitrophota bacterium]